MKGIVLTSILASMCIPSLVFASAWVRKEGEFFLSITSYHQSAKKYFDKDGNRKPIGCTFRKDEIQVYGEYGVDEKHTLTFKLPYDWLKCGPKETTGFGDLEVGLVRNISKGKNYSFSAYGNAVIPTGYSITDDPRIGYGRPAFEGGILYGFSGSWGFFDSGIGYRYYFGYPSSYLRAYGGGGINISENIQLLTFLDAQIGLGDGRSKYIGRNIFLEPDYKLLQIYVAPKINYGKLSIVPGYNKVLYGRNTGDAQGFFFGLWFNF